jgi:hypothetical protein
MGVVTLETNKNGGSDMMSEGSWEYAGNTGEWKTTGGGAIFMAQKIVRKNVFLRSISRE